MVVFTDSDHAGCLKTRKSTSPSTLFYGSRMLRSTSTTQGVISLSSGESEFYALLKGTSAGLGAVLMLKDLGVDIKKNTKIDKEVLEVRIDASAGRDIAVRRGAGRIRQIATPTLRIQKLTQDVKVKITKSLKSRTRQILEANTLTADQFDEHWREVIVTFLKEGLESRFSRSARNLETPS